MIAPGGRFVLDNPGGHSLHVVRSPDGEEVGFAQAGTEPVMVPLSFYRWLLEVCGYIVIAREDCAHLSGIPEQPTSGAGEP